MRADAFYVLLAAGMADYEQTLQRLAMNDERVVASLAQTDPELEGVCADAGARALVRLAALIASEGTCASYVSVVDSALAAGASVEDVIGVLLAVAPTVGSIRIVAAAPQLARAVGFDIDAAFDSDQPRAPLAPPAEHDSTSRIGP
jgi:4-carboxymuconolactone decarboxylase